MKPWREVAVPHKDVLEGVFLQSEFAADMTAVRSAKAPPEYQDPKAFFERTYITEGMRLLLTQVAKRLNSAGGEPVVQLQTAFGGGKTHTMLAVYHLATRECALDQLAGVAAILADAGLKDVPRARVAVLDGTAHSPGQPWNHGQLQVRTLWGELAWQLGGEAAFALLKASDESGTSPGKDLLQTILQKYAPCVILIDELVAYMRQFQEGQTLSGGTFDTNQSFIQALTEACKLVPNAALLGSLPESELEAGSQRGVMSLRALEKVFGRIQALWKPVATEEAFEIVRRRLFEPIKNENAREVVCRAFAEAYIAEAGKLPPNTQEVRYYDRLVQAYPFHPELFDRLYGDWSTIDGFQRTRGVLKLMAQVIFTLWKDDNKDLMIQPASLPLYDPSCRNELTYYLPAGWDPVLEEEIDGERSATKALENKEPRLGAVSAARRAARAIFLGSAPSSAINKTGNRGIDRAHVLLGCLQPGQSSSIYSDALNRLADSLRHLHASGEKTDENTRYWFDTRATLRREMEQRKHRFNADNEVRARMAEVLQKLSAGTTLFDGVHVFTPHADLRDDSALRLVFIGPENWYSREDDRLAIEKVIEFLQKNGEKPRFRTNRLVFIAADYGALARLRDCIQAALAWASIVADAADHKLVLDNLQIEQAKRELQTSEAVLPRIARECYKWLLCPVQESPTDKKIAVEVFPLNTSGSSFANEIERVCRENELVITTWAPVHLRARLNELYWKPDKPAVSAMAFFEDSMRYLYLPRLKDQHVLAQAISKGAGTKDFFATAYGEYQGEFDGFKFGDANVQLDDSLLLIEPTFATRYDEAEKLDDASPATAQVSSSEHASTAATAVTTKVESSSVRTSESVPNVQRLHSLHCSVEVKTSSAKMRMVDLADEIISVLASDVQAQLRVTVEISADFPSGVSEQIKRAVSENAATLGIQLDWE